MKNDKSLNREEKAITWAAIIAGLLFFIFFTFSTFLGDFKKDDKLLSDSNIDKQNQISLSPVKKSSNQLFNDKFEKDKLVDEDLKNKFDDLKDKYEELEETNTELISKLNDNVGNDSIDLKPLQAENQKLKIENNDFKNQYDDLKTRFQHLTGASNKIKSQLEDSVISANKLQDNYDKSQNIIKNLNAQIGQEPRAIGQVSSDGNLQTKLNKYVIENNNLNLLNADLDRKVKELTQKINDLNKTNTLQSGIANNNLQDLLDKKSNDFSELENKYKNLLDINSKLSAKVENQKNKANNNFVVEKEGLGQSASNLISELNKINNFGKDDLSSIYSEIQGQNTFSLLKSIPFGKGQSSVTPQTKSEINDFLNNAKQDSSFLIVGYASKDGSSYYNKKLASQRANIISNFINNNTNNNQTVTAYYFGETSRFNPRKLSDNRLVEIWEIKK